MNIVKTTYKILIQKKVYIMFIKKGLDTEPRNKRITTENYFSLRIKFTPG